MEKTKATESAKIWLKKETRPYWTFILFLTFFTVVATLLSLAFAYMMRYLINSASDGKVKQLWLFTIVILGLLLLRIALKTFTNYLSEKLRARMVVGLRTKLFAKILRSDYARLQEYHSGELLNRLTTDIQEVSAYTVGLLPSIAGMITQCIGAIVALMTIDPIFTAVYVVCGGIFGGITALFRKQMKKSQKDVLQSDGEFRAFMQEGVRSTLTIKAYGAETKTEEKVKRFADCYYQKRMKRNALYAFMNCIFSTLSNFGMILAVVWCSISVLNGNDDYGSILSVILLLMQLQHPFSAFSSIIPAYYARLTSGERLSEIDELHCEVLALQDKNYEFLTHIIFENLTFTYGRNDVLCGANAKIQKGEIVCLTGSSGAGKSTLFKLLLQVFVPTDGKIFLCGHNKEEQIELSAKDRGLFAYVPQGNFLFSGSIYENLTFFSNEKDENVLKERVREGIKTACAEFVWDLPSGLQTQLTEDGGGLSEGQLQRLAVARAIVSDRPILLLDEATSALDSETEKTLLQNIKNLQGKTCLIVTHRPAALEIADEILHVENGIIVKK
ncbi:MAG: ABC transporter ATP-binding protein [Clostridia bacterium]|nr:ABC transporter ATP-binding protein [Clostridia bacterium]